MNEFLGGLSGALQQAPAVALLAAAGWGVASVILSPCHLASIPLIIGYMADGGERLRPARAFSLSLVFGLGILATIAIVGLVTTAAGRVTGEVNGVVVLVVAALLIVYGLELLGLVRLPTWSRSTGTARRGYGGALLLGLGFGVVLGPCTFAFLAPVLGAAFAAGAAAPLTATGMVLAFAAGHCAVIVGAGTSANAVQRLLDWNERSRALARLRQAAGIAVIAGAFYLILQ